MHYAGIGARKTPAPELFLMTRIARALRERGYVLRTGHAPGADQAFEAGALDRAEVYLPWPAFERGVSLATSSVMPIPAKPAWEVARAMWDAKPDEHYLTHSPRQRRRFKAWDDLSWGTMALMARNVHQVLGHDCATPSRFVICWTADGKDSGGTGFACRVAREHDIPVFNLEQSEDRKRIMKMLPNQAEAA